ncbi:MAG: AAA family ATPase, partial [Holosporaceae bacterium]|nr:AAA family ATPase [Holosporaceae bacterium]
MKLSGKNFRSYRILALNFSSKFVVFYGENGAGKTNLLEAISLFSSDRGLRKAPLNNLNFVSSPAFSWHLELFFEQSGYGTQLSTSAPNGRRIARIDGSSVQSLAKFEELLWILWYVPNMDILFMGPMSDRRSFFDHLVSAHNKRHKRNLRQLAELQKERLHVIFHRKDENWLKVLEEKIADGNVTVTKSRKEFMELLQSTFAEYPSDFLRPIVSISGEIEQIYAVHSEEDAILEIAEILKRNRYADAERQSTSIGVHRSIWEARHPKTLLDAENCSSGEQKAFLISLILSVIRISRDHRGVPLLLLDDVMTHLDENSRRDLMNELQNIGVQTFFTGTDINLFRDVPDSSMIYRIK